MPLFIPFRAAVGTAAFAFFRAPVLQGGDFCVLHKLTSGMLEDIIKTGTVCRYFCTRNYPFGQEEQTVFQILVADDDRNTRRLFQALLQQQGYRVFTAENGVQALEVMDREHIDLVVLDVMMPGMDGYEVTQALRECSSNLPILMVSARQLPEDKRRGFLVGTDDYMTKPVDEGEMLLRIRALLRRARIASERRIVLGNVELDYDSLTVSRCGQVQQLPQKEFLLLYKLLSYPGKIFTRIQLMDEIWGTDSDSGWETVTVHIGRLRRRFEGWSEFEIVSVRGLGYKAVKKV